MGGSEWDYGGMNEDQSRRRKVDDGIGGGSSVTSCNNIDGGAAGRR